MIERDDSRTSVLCFGDDSALLNTRELILMRAGYRVRSLATGEITEQLDFSIYDVVLFCHSVSLSEAEWISCLMRSQNPEVLTVRITIFDSGQIPGFDAACDVSGGPGGLLETLARLCHAKMVAA